MPKLLMISGSLRSESTNTAALRTALELAPAGLTATLFTGMGGLPHFNPDDDLEGAEVDPAVMELRAALAGADAVLLCTPEYAGALPGSFKNLLEWTVGNGALYGKPVAWINVSGPAAPSGGSDAHDSLRKVLNYVSAEIVEAACVRIPVTRAAIDRDGIVEDAQLRAQIAGALDVIRLFCDPGHSG